MHFPLLLFLLPMATAFECFTCNDGPYDDDSKPCKEMKSVCTPGVTSCSMLVYRSTSKTHMRKFCSARNTPIHQYLSLLPGSSMCQNIKSKDGSRWRRAAPPAPPAESSTLLCVCSTPLCNQGTYKKVLENTMMNNLPRRRLPVWEELPEKDMPMAPERQPDSDLQRQMTEAGF